MNDNVLTERREQARRMCAERNVAIMPYGDSHWVKGIGVDLVIADLAWLRESDLNTYDAHQR